MNSNCGFKGLGLKNGGRLPTPCEGVTVSFLSIQICLIMHPGILSASSVAVIILASQARDPGSTPGWRTILLLVSCSCLSVNLGLSECLFHTAWPCGAVLAAVVGVLVVVVVVVAMRVTFCFSSYVRHASNMWPSSMRVPHVAFVGSGAAPTADCSCCRHRRWRSSRRTRSRRPRRQRRTSLATDPTSNASCSRSRTTLSTSSSPNCLSPPSPRSQAPARTRAQSRARRTCGNGSCSRAGRAWPPRRVADGAPSTASVPRCRAGSIYGAQWMLSSACSPSGQHLC